MKNLLYTLLAVVLFAACSDDDNTPVQPQKNYIELSTTSATTFAEDSENAIDVVVTLGRAVAAPAIVNVMLDGNEDGVLSIDNPTINFDKGEQVKSFKVISNNKSLLIEPRTISVRVKDFSDSSMAIWKDGIDLTVNPAAAIPPITEEQKALLDAYQENLGFDVRRMLGKLSCDVKLIFPKAEVGEEGESAFSKVEIQEFKSQSVITLSENATAEKPVLKMVDNALGLTSVFRSILEKEIENVNQVGTSFPSVADAVKFNVKNETFAMTLDDIVLKADGAVQFVGIVEDSYGDKIKGVPFEYAYSVWDRQEQMAKEGATVDIVVKDPFDGSIMNSEPEKPMTSCIEEGLTFRPGHYLISSDISSDGWESGIWKEALASFDLVNGQMKFVFSWDHSYSSDWTLIEVSYNLRPATK